MRFLLFFLAISSLSMLACDKRSAMEKIEDYLSRNNLTATPTASGLYYIITEEGSGGHPNLQSTVTVRYKGYRLNGEVFDETPGNETRSWPLKNLIEGWQIGIPLLQKGGKATFFIPPELGYGTQKVGSIPGNSVLIFEIELVDF